MQDINLHYLGIRHHGVGSAIRLRDALDKLTPQLILIEGPSDCNELIPQLADKGMSPPVALLGLSIEQPEYHIFYPFTHYSPEYQAILWGVSNHADLAFIDIPLSIQLNEALEKETHTEYPHKEKDKPPKEKNKQPQSDLLQDPIALLAKQAHYEDIESWWNDYIEQNQSDSMLLFRELKNVMETLRNSIDILDENRSPIQKNSVREAYMRLEIDSHLKKLKRKISEQSSEINVVIVCGAWHLPALEKNIPLKEDRALIKSLPAKISTRKIKKVWVPWSSNRLSRKSGYGAGVAAPMWYQHLWENQHNPNSLDLWIAKIAHKLREKGHHISTASLIDASRLSHTLTSIRNRPTIGFEEVIDSVVASLCFGDNSIWDSIANEMLLGNVIGQIPAASSDIPILEDFKNQVRTARLKLERQHRELKLDLRTKQGACRSFLFHRLNILGIQWGTVSKYKGKSRGTFVEYWQVQWDPQYEIILVECLVYGNTIEEAATTVMIQKIDTEERVDLLAKLVEQSLKNDLKDAIAHGLEQLNRRSAFDCDVLSIIRAIPPLISVHRYGTARQIDLTLVKELIERLVLQAAFTLPNASRSLDNDEAYKFRDAITDIQQSIHKADLSETAIENWWLAILTIATTKGVNFLLAGLTTRLAYLNHRITPKDVELKLRKTLSPAIETSDAALFFDGFFAGAIKQLQYDDHLLDALMEWVSVLENDSFMEALPLFRRTFSSLNKIERQRILSYVAGKNNKHMIYYEKIQLDRNFWTDHLKNISKFINRPRKTE